MATASFRQTLRTMVAVLGAVAMTLLFVAVPTAHADHVEPETRSGNPTCADFSSADADEFKVEGDGSGENQVASGTYEDPDGPLEVDIEVRDTEAGWVFDWDANIGVDAVFAKGGEEGGNLYRYDPEEAADTGLHAPENPSNTYAGLSHVSFCYDYTLDLTVDKVNDADQDGTFTDRETAPAPDADVRFRVTVSVPDAAEAAPVDLSSATDAYPAGDGHATVDLFELCDNLSDATVIAPGESVTCTFTLEGYAPPSGESLQDTVTVEGHAERNSERTVFAEDDSTVDTATDEQPAAIGLTVEKVNDANADDSFTDSETAPAEGASVPFRVTITAPDASEASVVLDAVADAYPTNDGDTSNDTVVDLFDQCDELSDSTVLAPGQSVTCTFTLEGYAPPAGASIDDTVTVEGHEQGDADNTTSDQDDSTVTTPSATGPAEVALTVDKVNDADGDGTFSDSETAPAEGATVDFRVTVAVPEGTEAPVDLSSATDAYPTGDGDPSNDTTIDLFDECDGLSDDTVIAPGESVTCTFTLDDYAAAPGEAIENTVVVEGHEQGDADNTTSDQDDSAVTTEDDEVGGEQDQRDDTTTPAEQPAIAVTKSALVDPDADGRRIVTFVPGDGDEETVTYRYEVTNTGDTTLVQVQLTDDVLGTVMLDDTELAPGESTTATATHVLSAADAGDGDIVNVATAVGTSPDGEQVRATDDARVLVAEVLSEVESAGDVRAAAEADDQLPATGADPLEAVVLAIMMLALGGTTLLWTRMGTARG